MERACDNGPLHNLLMEALMVETLMLIRTAPALAIGAPPPVVFLGLLLLIALMMLLG
jgi:hypothetical protein